MKKRFGIDIDGTVTCPETFIPYINKEFNLNLTLDDLTEYEFTSCVDLPKEQFNKWFLESEPHIYAASPLASGAREVLSKWKEQHELYFISARADSLRKITEEWFSSNDLHYHHIELIGSHDKVGTAKRHEVDLFFEDKHDNAVSIAEELHIPVILFDTPYNRLPAPDNVIRVKNWQEAEAWVAQWIQSEQKIKEEA